MAKIIMLGTGNGITVDLYNTCFVIQNTDGNFLVDTGGSIELLKRLEQVDIDYKTIKNIFISHSHTDHVLGLLWYFKKISRLIMKNEITETINIFCNDTVYETITEISKYIMPSKLMKAIYSKVNFIVVNDKDKHVINGVEYEFFDIHARSTKQYGFECIIDDKKLVFLGDEPLKSDLYVRVMNADLVMHEAFCLDSEDYIFHAYEINHSTVKSTCEVMKKLGVKNLILYHTEESHGNDRKRLYEEEGKQYFNGTVLVPDDLEEFEIKTLKKEL